MASVDTQCIMNLLKIAGDEKLKSDNSNSGRSSRTKGTDDASPKEVPAFILRVLVS